MAIVKWNRYFPSMWPSSVDEDRWPSLQHLINWPELSSSSGLDIYETDNEVVVKAAVPGLADNEVEVTVEGNVLTITGEHNETDEETKSKKNVYKSTRQTSFSYSTSLPRMVDGSKARAEVENGVVTVSVPKSEEGKMKKIEVKKKQ